jgi:hypothetical protein
LYRFDKTRQRKPSQAKTSQDKTRQETTRHDTTRDQTRRDDTTRKDKTRHDTTRQRKTAQGNARQDDKQMRRSVVKKERKGRNADRNSPAGNSTLPTSCEARPVVIMSQFVRPSTTARRKSPGSTFDKDQTRRDEKRRDETRQGKTRSDQTRPDKISTHKKKRVMLRAYQ